jgi:hypothetical protein
MLVQEYIEGNKKTLLPWWRGIVSACGVMGKEIESR